MLNVSFFVFNAILHRQELTLPNSIIASCLVTTNPVSVIPSSSPCCVALQNYNKHWFLELNKCFMHTWRKYGGKAQFRRVWSLCLPGPAEYLCAKMCCPLLVTRICLGRRLRSRIPQMIYKEAAFRGQKAKAILLLQGFVGARSGGMEARTAWNFIDETSIANTWNFHGKLMPH